jgi:rhomboid protease GluP
VIGLTVVVSFVAMTPEGFFLYDLLQLDKQAVARGEYWRLFSVTLLHSPASLLHLVFNMYALFLAGPIVEQLYGSRLFLLFYLLCAAAGSTASFVFGGDVPAVGASGAIFGLFGLLLAASRAHHPVLDQRSRSLVGQLGMLILINLAFGFAVPNIDNAAHIGGLVAGLWLGFLFVPGRVPTLRSFWQGAGEGARRAMGVPALGVAALVAVIVVGVVVGTGMRDARGVATATGTGTFTAEAPDR